MTVIIRLTEKQAELVRRNVDGWLDAGACEGGLTKAEHAALWCVQDQIREQTTSKNAPTIRTQKDNLHAK